jgi:hypothetical protein
MKLDVRVRNSVEQWKAGALCDENTCKIAWERRLGDGAGVGHSGVQVFPEITEEQPLATSLAMTS